MSWAPCPKEAARFARRNELNTSQCLTPGILPLNLQEPHFWDRIVHKREKVEKKIKKKSSKMQPSTARFPSFQHQP